MTTSRQTHGIPLTAQMQRKLTTRQKIGKILMMEKNVFTEIMFWASGIYEARKRM